MHESPRAEERNETPHQPAQAVPTKAPTVPTTASKPMPKEIGGRGGLEPTRYGDWEKDGRCIDF